MATTRTQALSLYRRILRTANNCGFTVLLMSKYPNRLVIYVTYVVLGKGNLEEQQWIRKEAKEQYEIHRHLTDSDKILNLIQKGHDQVDIALHHQIPYPRPVYVDPYTIAGDTEFHRSSSREHAKLGRLSKHRRLKSYRTKPSQ